MTPQWFRRELNMGMQGPDVATVQRKVGALPTGTYDDETAARVRGFQMTKRKAPTGEVDAATAAELGDTPAVTPDWYTRELQMWFEGPDVAALAARLGLVGDDRFTPDVEAAVRRYQSQHRLPVTGKVDEQFARHLG